ncbi:BZ3500_MvSof-1268-A1-R1_Chr2-3g05237 [Microbotryum saponariae]|uniref:DNA polymerase n=1 Tax=Microbotryum saponariae TaxID=289078 RepID=A0A2X0K5Q5_9BASI|nr:BZ3500_MvSof-1268-A1-R1_Chr2-3g05237 [Microbotryum saponariae]SDA01063.1 BZ3501_MvSof-1269-A2-R1_Chr2-2g04910 [Microbotryum saponariae]
MASREAKRKQLEALKAARAGGGRVWENKEQAPVFDVVDEESYRSVVKGRLAEDDFIEEDGGVTGYADNGEDHWDRSDEEGHSDDEERELREAAQKQKKKEREAKKQQSAAALKRKAKQPILAPGANPYIKPAKEEAEVEDFMASLMGDLDGQETVVNKSKPKPQPAASTSKLDRFAKSTSLSSLKRRAGADDPMGAERGIARTTSSSDVHASDPLSSEPYYGNGRETGPSSDGDETATVLHVVGKKARFSEVEHDLGGAVQSLAFAESKKGNEIEQDVDAANTTIVKVKAEEDAEEDDDNFFVKPSAPVVKPKGAPVRRQLVNTSATKAAAVKPERIELNIPGLPAAPPLAVDAKAKPKGTDWRTATSQLAAVEMPANSMDDVNMSDASLGDDADNPLPVPESLRKVVKTTDVVLEQVQSKEEDGSLRFYWFDYVEPSPGQLCLVGKVKVTSAQADNKGKVASKADRYASACLTVTGLRRKLFVLPRAKALDMDGNEIDDEDGPEFDDVVADFDDTAESKWNVKNLEVVGETWVKKKYSFGIKGIPREETDWVEFASDFPDANLSSPSIAKFAVDIPLNASGERFSHVFGSTASAFETFVVANRIMGPCWLNVKAPVYSDPKKAGATWTKLEVSADHSTIHPFSDQDPTAPTAAPPLTIMSLSMRTVVHITDNKREVVCAAARVWTDANIDDPTPLEKQPSQMTSMVRNLFTPFPVGFEVAARATAKTSRDRIIPFKDEKTLLTQLVSIIFRHDPDIIVGHDFVAGDLDVLLNRLKELGIETWSKVGRFRRPKWPKLTAGRNLKLLDGRLTLDLSSDNSKAVIDSTTWTLTEMCKTHLDIDREDIDPEDTAKYFDNVHSTAAQLLHFVQHCGADCYLQMAVAFKVQVLPLTRQLTVFAGNSWNKTLAGNRAERNEYVLLHKFTALGYVCPDKVASWEKKAQIAKEDAKSRKGKKGKADEEGEAVVKVEMKKAKFTGGLVFEPIKGLWDRYVLVMDFNSLYPSIIQEFDIDFSTIDWTADEAQDVETMPERRPCEGEPQGILPDLIAGFVKRRRQVKNNMKDKNVSASKMQQYDITQKALKLTANSMYGCLGYEGSRFYAKPLAALTTFKGREILTNTKADAESLGLSVIYGDTDSVMINTNQTDIQAAFKIGNDFTKLINDKYKKLEIDTDAVFQRLLLLNKKKYAARKVEDDGTIKTEVKGLDMKRREFCALSKGASQFVLDCILSGESTEVVIEQIHEYLSTLGERIRAGVVPVDEYIIFKRLGKNPQDYPDAKSLPHVQVALRMQAKGQSAKSGDVVPYIFCLPADGVSAKSAKAVNAHHPDDVRRQGSTLKIDFEVYLGVQVLPPIERLCEHIDGTEKARLAECLGLDVTRYRSTVDAPERDFKTLHSQVSDAQRFRDVEPLRIRCRVCETESIFDGLVKNSVSDLHPSIFTKGHEPRTDQRTRSPQTNMVSKSGFFCTNTDCLEPLSTASIAIQIDNQIRGAIAKFYEGVMVCDEPTCGYKSRMMSVYGKRCLNPGLTCRGTVHFEYNDLQLYNQILFFDTLFDLERARTKAASTTTQDQVNEIMDAQKPTFETLRSVITKHLEKNGRRWVNMQSLFGFMSVVNR